MPLGLTITINDQATGFISRLNDMLQSVKLRKVMARGTERDVRDHLIDYDKRNPNKHVNNGWRRTHVFRDAARATHGEAIDRGIRISINHPMIGLRYHGGDIRPVKAKALAIPVDPSHPAADPRAAEAYGNSPRKFHHLRLIQLSDGKAALVANDRTEIKKDHRKGREGKYRGKELLGGVYYWIVQKAHIKKDATVLPKERTLLENAVKYADDYLEPLDE